MSDALKPRLPAMPEPDIGVWNHETSSWTAHSTSQLRALRLATWRAAIEYAAQQCDRMRAVSAVSYETGAACAAAIRQSPDPTEAE